MKYWLKTFNHLNMHKEIFSDKASLITRLREIIESSKQRMISDEIKKCDEALAYKYIDKHEHSQKVDLWKNWPGFSYSDLCGKTDADNRECTLGSIKIVHFDDDTKYDGYLFLGG